jgi:hypothetical protein
LCIYLLRNECLAAGHPTVIHTTIDVSRIVLLTTLEFAVRRLNGNSMLVVPTKGSPNPFPHHANHAVTTISQSPFEHLQRDRVDNELHQHLQCPRPALQQSVPLHLVQELLQGLH